MVAFEDWTGFTRLGWILQKGFCFPSTNAACHAKHTGGALMESLCWQINHRVYQREENVFDVTSYVVLFVVLLFLVWHEHGWPNILFSLVSL